MSKYEVGEELVCVKAESKFYTVGKEYKVIEHEGVLGTFADDNLFDPCSLVLTRFRSKQPKKTANRKAKVNT